MMFSLGALVDYYLLLCLLVQNGSVYINRKQRTGSLLVRRGPFQNAGGDVAWEILRISHIQYWDFKGRFAEALTLPGQGVKKLIDQDRLICSQLRNAHSKIFFARTWSTGISEIINLVNERKHLTHYLGRQMLQRLRHPESDSRCALIYWMEPALPQTPGLFRPF